MPNPWREKKLPLSKDWEEGLGMVVVFLRGFYLRVRALDVLPTTNILAVAVPIIWGHPWGHEGWKRLVSNCCVCSWT